MGKLVVKIICGRNLKGSDMFSDCDGYVKLTIGSKNFRTKAINNDKNPNWNESFSFYVTEAGCDVLKLELWDANTFKDDLLANASVPLNDLVKDHRVLKRVAFSEGKGEVHLELLADFGLPNPNPGQPDSLASSFSQLPTPPQQNQAPPPQQQQQYSNPYSGAQGQYGNPYANQQQRPPSSGYQYPGNNPYGAAQYTGGPPPQAPQQHSPYQQQQRPPQQQQPGGYPSAGSYGGYANPYAHHHQHNPQNPQQPRPNPYATQYPGSAGAGGGGAPPGQYSYPGQHQPRPNPQQPGSNVGGLGYLPGSVGGVNYY